MDSRRGFLKKCAAALAAVGLGPALPEIHAEEVFSEVAAETIPLEFGILAEEDAALNFGEMVMQQMAIQFKEKWDEWLVTGEGQAAIRECA